MKANFGILKSLRTYWKQKFREGVQHVITGGGIAYLLVHFLHNAEFFKNNGEIEILIFIAISLLPFIVDFLFFLKHHPEVTSQLHDLESIVKKLLKLKRPVIQIIIKALSDDIAFFRKISERPLDQFEAANYFYIQNKGNKAEREILKSFKKKNQLLVDFILSNLDKELNLVTRISNNRLELPCLQHFDYLRDVLGRTLKEVMKSGDHYITLASLDFWTLKNFDPETFLKVNLEAAFDAHKCIDRIIIIDKKFLTGEGLGDTDLIKFNDFVSLISIIKETTYELQYNYDAKIKILFYFHNNYKSIRNFLDSVIVINSKLNQLMFIKVQKLSNIANNINNQVHENPNILISFFEFNSPSALNIESHDIIQLLKHIKTEVENKIQIRFENHEEYERLVELNKYLTEFRKYFEKIPNIYNIEEGKKNETIDFGKCDLYDVEMMYQHYNELKERKPQLFLS